MSDPVNWGVMGNATIARKCVIPAIQKSGTGRVTALATRSPAAAAETAREFGIPNVYEGFERLLSDETIDAVYIPLPNHLHMPWALKSLAAGKHVLCEKPMAMNAEEAAKMAAAAEAADRLLMEAFMYRFHPRSRKIRDMVASGEIGTPRLVRAAFCFRIEDDVYETGDNIRLRLEMGGGALLDTGCYGVSVARWLLGEEPGAVQAQALYHKGGVDCQITGSLIFPGGAVASIEASFITALQQTYSVVGSEAAIELPHDAFIPWEKDTFYVFRKRSEDVGKHFKVAGADEYRLMVTHFSRALRGQTAPAYSTADSVANMRVLDALAEAARTGNRTEVQSS